MKHDPIASGKRKSVNLSIDTGVVSAAREAGINLSQVSEAALRVAAKRALEVRWREEHREWIEANNAWVDEHGLPLEKYRLF
ncbi:type II toxin-antitoxin system CcdA family antitoxin [Sphingomonas radiodurans]|uniref:type II toxin-antitoxin system CcdA family antitoxin n=1 Tax=Sphingomonas radiodurans TaxID=2890321 RepID=UPI001E383152|nr:type II toxin-antitoxin system CcdA family antitoxin [Sphingomonas radiodurans]WBH15253.1 type II toxin-antitoxin system CcdA family antitoxin [Sphingomonas radiodurans]